MAISLVAMIDVLMILLVFFMVTSTYLDLDMVSLSGAEDAGGTTVAGATPGRLLIRLDDTGTPQIRGRAIDHSALGDLVATRLAADDQLDVLVLPSGQANVQALARLMDTLAGAGADRLRIIRLEARP